MKGNHGEVREALRLGIESEKGGKPPDVVEMDKQHGRLEIREYWWVEGDAEMRAYLADEYGWPEVRWYGRVRRKRRPLHQEVWSTEEVIVLYGGESGPAPTPRSSAGGHVAIGKLKTASFGC